MEAAGGGRRSEAIAACRVLNGVLGAWYMRSYSTNLLFIAIMLTALKVRAPTRCSTTRHTAEPREEQTDP